jgi:hypothetical protein
MKSFKTSKKTFKKNLKVRKLRSKKIVRKNKRGGVIDGKSNGVHGAVRVAQDMQRLSQKANTVLFPKPLLRANKRVAYVPVGTDKISNPFLYNTLEAVQAAKRSSPPSLPVQTPQGYTNVGVVSPVVQTPVYEQMITPPVIYTKVIPSKSSKGSNRVKVSTEPVVYSAVKSTKKP